MIQSLAKVTKAIDQVGLAYIVGDESLLGLSENNLDQYRFNPVLFQLPVSMAWLRYIALALMLFSQGIIVKPKIVYGQFRLKIRAKLGPLKKAQNFIFLIPLKQSEDQFFIKEIGRSCHFPISSILPLETVMYQHIPLWVPHNLDEFALRYRKELLSNSYRKHSVVFDKESAQKAESMLFKIADILNHQNSHWWLEGGTLLGLYRDGKLLDWDHDIDLGLRFESEAQVNGLLKVLKKTEYFIKILDFPKKKELWKPGKIRLFKIFPRRFYFFHTDLCVDLFIFYREDLLGMDEPVYKYVVHERNGYHPSSILDDLDDLMYRGHRLGRPRDAEAFLASKYGENWKTPVKEWHVAIDDKTILNNMENS